MSDSAINSFHLKILFISFCQSAGSLYIDVQGCEQTHILVLARSTGLRSLWCFHVGIFISLFILQPSSLINSATFLIDLEVMLHCSTSL